MITITIVRHGESTDNVRAVWAGWQDAPLSNHAKALGASLATTEISAIYASPLKRALWTAQQIEEQNETIPKPTLTESPLLREQHFGVAEGKPFGTENGRYTRMPGRDFKFPEGETLNDVRKRANEAIAAFVEPALKESQGQLPSSKHLVFVAHGIFNHEFISAIMARRPEGINAWEYRGMTNTGWTRLEVGYEGEVSGQATSPAIQPEYFNGLPPFNAKILVTDVTSHLDNVHRQKGGIGSAAHDQKQSDIRKFFSGAGDE
ncbi:putative phosphatase [Vanrija pseudolonga]|uniref:Phosphatase n=1 Tax=Vanrija pseudolonga TaxID=143232 RepID=A0AAF0YHB8_9TREE|nr:putative phosphatase [Vanrija pseudolonga]